MRSCALVSLLSGVSCSDQPGAFSSISEASLNQAGQDVVTEIVSALQNLDIKGKQTPLFDFDDFHFEEFTIGSFGITTKEGEGLEISLQKMTNTIAPVPLCVHDPLRLKKCCGSMWASATGQSYTGLNTIVVDEKTGLGQMVTTTPKGGFAVGDIQIHHQMEGIFCELLADTIGLVDGVVIDLVSTAMQVAFPKIVATVVDVPANLVLGHLESPPALGFGEEKFRLDNSFISVDYSDHRITHYHKGEFMSTANPKESRQTPPQLVVPNGRDVAIGFSDYTLNTLFEALKTEHMFETQIDLPIQTPSSLKLCSDCPVVVLVTFKTRGEAEFMGGKATNTLHGMKFEVGLKTKPLNIVAPMFTVTVDAVASVDFDLEQLSGKAPHLKATLSLDSFSQKDVISVIGEIDTADVNRDIELVLNSLMDNINNGVPALPILSVPGVKYANPSFEVDNHQLIMTADFVKASGHGPSPPPAPATGGTIQSTSTGLCLDVPGGDTTNGQIVWMWECYGGDTQNWSFQDDQLVYLADPSKCIDLLGGDTTNGNQLGIWDCYGGDSQKWGFDSDEGTIYLASSGDATKCVNGGDSPQGSPIVIWDCDGEDHQVWKHGASLAQFVV